MLHSSLRSLSFESVAGSIKSCFNRFHFSVTNILLLSVWFIINIWDNVSISDKLFSVVSYGLSIGALFSLVITLLFEELKFSNDKFYFANVAQLIIELFIIADCYWLYVSYEHLGQAILLAHTSVVSALIVSVFFISFIREKRDIVSWNFTYRLVESVCVVFVISLVMFLSSIAIYGALSTLFSIKCIEILFTMYTVGGFTIPVLIFLGRIPSGADKWDDVAHTSRFLTLVTKFLFIPTIAILYMVLYVYLIKILLQWELPKGTVCSSVSGAILGCVVIEYLLFPSRNDSKASFENRIAKWLPVILIPLLGLMTMAIGYRIYEYGITAERLYILTLNIWAYFMCGALYVTNARRVSWIPISCAAVFLFTSLFPYINYSQISERVVLSNLKSVLMSQNVTRFPMTQLEYNALIKSLDRNTANLIEGKLHYLQNDFGEEALSDVVKIDLETQPYWSAWSALNEDVNTDTVVVERFYDIEFGSNAAMSVPDGYTKVQYESIRYNEISLSYNNIDSAIIVNIKDNDFALPHNRLSLLSSDGDSEPFRLPALSGDDKTLFFLTSCVLKVANDEMPDSAIIKLDKLNLSGFIFEK